MLPKTTTIPMIENIEHHPRQRPESLAVQLTAAAFAIPLECEGLISRRSDSTSAPAVAMMYDTSVCTGKRSPHHNTSECPSRFHKVSARVDTITGLAEDSTARNSFFPQRPRKFSASRLC